MRYPRILFIVAVGALIAASPTIPLEAQPLGGTPQRGIGIAVTFPFAFLPTTPATTTAMFFLDVLAQGQFNDNLAHRLELRFFFDTAGFQTSLTSLRESVLVLFTPSPAIFYIGGGAGVFSVRVPAVPASGLLLALLLRTGVEVQVFPLGLFLDISFETMPQPFADIAGGTFSPQAISVLQLSFGALIHF